MSFGYIITKRYVLFTSRLAICMNAILKEIIIITLYIGVDFSMPFSLG